MDEDLLDYTTPEQQDEEDAIQAEQGQQPNPANRTVPTIPIPQTGTMPAVSVPASAPAPVVAPSVSGTAPMIPVTMSRLDPTTGQRTTTVAYFDANEQAKHRQAAAEQAFYNQLSAQYSRLPLAQAEAAAAAALRFQGIRQYQRDLASGMSPGAALARSAPLIYGRASQGTIGQAGQFIKSLAPAQKKLIDVGGVLYRQEADGSVTALTDNKPTIPKADAFDVAEFRNVMGDVAKIDKDLQEEGISPQRQAQLGADRRTLMGRASEIRNRGLHPAGLGISGLSVGPNAGGRVRVRAPNGKTGSIPRINLDRARRAGYAVLP